MPSAWPAAPHGALTPATASPSSPPSPQKQLQGSITEITTDDDGNSTTPGAAETDPTAPPAKNMTFDAWAGNMLCKNGLKLANCSGINPCSGKRCYPGSMCIVDMCGECTGKCVSYAEIGAGLNKVLSSVGISSERGPGCDCDGPGRKGGGGGAAGPRGGVLALDTKLTSNAVTRPNIAPLFLLSFFLSPEVKTDVPTPNLPIVDKLVGGVEQLAKTVLPKCPANTIIDIAGLRCKACPDGGVAAAGSTTCTICGRGK